MMICKICNEQKPVEDFSVYKAHGKEYRRRRCIVCHREIHARNERNRRAALGEEYRSYRREYMRKNPEKGIKSAEYAKKWREENSDYVKERKVEKYKKDMSDPLLAEKKRAYSREHTAKRRLREEVKVKEREYNYRFNRSPRGKIRNAVNAAKYRFRKAKASPAWLTEDQFSEMENFYIHAKDCSVVTGEVYHVDHIIPLAGKNVCGLHVPWNLQIIPADMNFKKKNKVKEELVY